MGRRERRQLRPDQEPRHRPLPRRHGPHRRRVRGRPVRREQQYQPAVVGAHRRRQRPHQEPRHRPVRRRHGPHRLRLRPGAVQRQQQHQPAVADNSRELTPAGGRRRSVAARRWLRQQPL
ncbi:hypothetical protein SCOCK_380062 [Actinacidiphila cocklensis]|uniref:Uncharacterized protein n=1 Tax=Actinacidiphila cocklensis TaxID=887465 RepID=A0A9W4DYT4_9ACTN|nr:hypothetical protein SCOCK_380062 [Actinacidiphila cocklensis]